MSFSFRLKLFKTSNDSREKSCSFRNVSTLRKYRSSAVNEGKTNPCFAFGFKTSSISSRSSFDGAFGKISKSTSCRTTYVAFSVRLHPDKAKFRNALTGNRVSYSGNGSTAMTVRRFLVNSRVLVPKISLLTSSSEASTATDIVPDHVCASLGSTDFNRSRVLGANKHISRAKTPWVPLLSSSCCTRFFFSGGFSSSR